MKKNIRTKKNDNRNKKQKKVGAKTISSKNNQNASSNHFSRGFLKTLKRYDLSILIIVLLLTFFGVAMVFSAGYYSTINISDPDPFLYLKRQLFFAFSGFVILLLVANFDYHRYSKISNILIVVSILLLVLVLLFGININGSTRWLGIGALRITPSEFSKLFVIIFTSVFLAKDPDNIRTTRGLGILLAVMMAHFVLVIMQPNLSTAIVLVVIIIAIMIVAGMNLLYLSIPTLLAVAGYFYILTFQKPYHWYVRLTSFTDPFADSQGGGYQVTQGLIALGNGGVKGMGFGKSLTKNLYLPEPQNDFILAIIGEELGYIGFLILMAVYILLLFRLFMIALRAKDSLGFYLATGVAVMLGIQVIINVAVVTASMPATGITLPFISYGGTSIWIFMASIGVALNVSKKRKGIPRGRANL